MSVNAAIGILTFHRCINYGSYWQARCLVEGLRAAGRDAVLMDHRSPTLDRREWRCALAPVSGAPGGAEDRQAYARKARRFFEAFETLPLSAPFPLDRPEEASPFDTIVVGSDEVWNLRHPWYGGQSVFYGEGLRGDLVSYAASFGNQDAAHGLDWWWSERLRSFSAIAVRDQNSRRIVAEALQREVELVLDPCLQFPDAIAGEDSEIESPYALVYGHSFPRWFADAVRAWADKRGLQLVSVGYRNDWADLQWIDAGPEEFAGLFAPAAAVATNFFHGCVFSLLNRKPFACAPSDYRNNKVRDLLALLAAPERLAGPDDALGALLEQPPSMASYERIDGLRLRSRRYLDHVLD